MSNAAPALQEGFWPWELDPDYQPNQRASALYGARTCAAYMFLGQSQKLRAKEHGNVYTGVGTIGHKWLELRIQMGPEIAAKYLLGKLDQVPDDFPQALDEVWEWLGESGHLIRGAEYLTEHEVEFQAGSCLLTGHIDLIQVLRTLGVVSDWKFYNDLSWLPPIEEDLQMYAYGVGAAILCPELEHIQVHRVACYHLKSEVLDLGPETLALAREALTEEVDKIWANRTTFTPGAQCLTCLIKKDCPAFASHEAHLDTTEIVPYTSGEVDSAEHAIKLMIACKVVEGRIDAVKDACKRWVESNAKIEDPSTKKLWGPWSSKKDTIMDPAAALGQLGKLVGSTTKALAAAKTSKSGMEAVMKDQKGEDGKGLFKPKERKDFFDSLRASGVIERREGSDKWEWRNPPKPKKAK